MKAKQPGGKSLQSLSSIVFLSLDFAHTLQIAEEVVESIDYLPFSASEQLTIDATALH